MNVDIKNKNNFDIKPILVYTVIIVLGFFSAKVGFVFLNKRSSSVLHSASRVPVKTTVNPIVNPVPIAPENILFKSENKKKTSVSTEVPVPLIYASEEESAKFILNGIAFSEELGQTSFVLINNKVVKIGEKVAGAEVTKIYRNSVELKTKDSKIVTLSQKK